MKPRHIMNFSENETLKMDRVCRLLRSVDVNYLVTTNDYEEGKTLWTITRMSKTRHIELKALAIGCVFGIEHEQDMVGIPQSQHIGRTDNVDYGIFVTMPTEEVL